MPYTNLGTIWPGLGYSTGSGVGTGLARTLQSDLDLLAKKKLSDLGIHQELKYQKKLKKQRAEDLSSYYQQPGVAEFLASQPDNIRIAMMSDPSFMGNLQQHFASQSPLQQLQPQAEQMPQAQGPQQTGTSDIGNLLGNLMQFSQQQQPQLNPTYAKLMQMAGQQLPGQGFTGMEGLMPQLQQMQAPQLSPEVAQQVLRQQAQQPQQQMQQPQQQPMQQQPVVPAPVAIKGAKGAKTAHQEEMERIAQESATEKVQTPIRKYIAAQREHYEASAKASKLAETMLDQMKVIKNRWPDFITGNMSEKAKAMLLRDPLVRTIMGEANELMILKAQSRRGLPSNFKIKLEGLAKADVSQPYGTAINLLRNTVNDHKDETQRMKFLLSLKGEKGTYPGDTESRILDYDIKQTEQREKGALPDAAGHAGEKYMNAAGQIVISDGKNWNNFKGK